MRAGAAKLPESRAVGAQLAVICKNDHEEPVETRLFQGSPRLGSFSVAASLGFTCGDESARCSGSSRLDPRSVFSTSIPRSTTPSTTNDISSLGRRFGSSEPKRPPGGKMRLPSHETGFDLAHPLNPARYRDNALLGGARLPSSHVTRRWREEDSNHRPAARRASLHASQIPPGDARRVEHRPDRHQSGRSATRNSGTSRRRRQPRNWELPARGGTAFPPVQAAPEMRMISFLPGS
jgi:hypothetical protein